MEFGRATETDISQLIVMRLAYLSEDYHGVSEEQTETIKLQLTDYFKAHLSKELFVYICRENKEIISTVFLLVVEKPANPNFITGKTGTILNVYTKPGYRKQGIAGKLLGMAMGDAKQMSLSFLELNATAEGLSLYTKLGFAPVTTKHTYMKYIV